MDDSIFCDSFHFSTIALHRHHYTDNRAGTPTHFLGCLKDGWARLTDGNVEIIIHPGELFYIPRGCRYQSYWYAEDMIRWLSLGFTVWPNPSRRSFQLQKIDCTPTERALLDYFLVEDRAVDAYSVSMLYQLMASLSEHMTKEIIDRRRDIVERAMLYMNRQKSVSADEIAHHCGVGTSTLYQAFRRTLGKTPLDVWHEIQTQRAIELLTTTDIPIEEISFRLGFSSSPHFRRIFEAQTGKTPREIRRASPFFTTPAKAPEEL